MAPWAATRLGAGTALTRQFSILSLLMIGLITAMLATVISYSLRKDLLDREWRITADYVQTEAFSHLAPSDFAYTDAKTAKPGLLEAADGGTLFLDEIGHMDLALQIKLLKAIEDKSVRRLGGLRTKSVNARIIAATNRDLEAAIAAGHFRADLYYRIKVLTIDVPPLRARGADIMLLARHFLDRLTRQYGLPAKALSPEAEALLLRYPWPGNVRELAHLIERVVLLHSGGTVKADDLGLARGQPETLVVVGSSGGGVQVDFSLGGITLDEVERQLIVKALEVSGGNRTEAAQLLGISRDTLRYRIEKHQL